MLLMKFLRKLSFEINKRNDAKSFAVNNVYMLGEDEYEELEVGESFVSVTGNLGFARQ